MPQKELDLGQSHVIDQMDQAEPVESKVEVDEITQKVTQAFDYEFDGSSTFKPYQKPDVPDDFDIGLIVGPSGSGKSLLLNKFGQEKQIEWDNSRSLISHFDNHDEAIRKFTAVGLNSIPTWAKPFNVLSGGEKFRANLARKLEDGMIVDEFTSVVNRDVAKTVSTSLSQYVDSDDLSNIVLASPHEDIIEWLEPSWVASTYDGVVYDGDHLRRPEIELDIYESSHEIWPLFKEHHYLDESLNNRSRSYVAKWNGKLVAFSCILVFPHPDIENAWREHRTVVLPDYQGVGIGTNFVEALAEMYLDDGCRFYSRTAHPRIGHHREKSDLWKATRSNKTATNRDKNNEGKITHWNGDGRVCYSHEYVG